MSCSRSPLEVSDYPLSCLLPRLIPFLFLLSLQPFELRSLSCDLYFLRNQIRYNALLLTWEGKRQRKSSEIHSLYLSLPSYPSLFPASVALLGRYVLTLQNRCPSRQETASLATLRQREQESKPLIESPVSLAFLVPQRSFTISSSALEKWALALFDFECLPILCVEFCVVSRVWCACGNEGIELPSPRLIQSHTLRSPCRISHLLMTGLLIKRILTS